MTTLIIVQIISLTLPHAPSFVHHKLIQSCQCINVTAVASSWCLPFAILNNSKQFKKLLGGSIIYTWLQE